MVGQTPFLRMDFLCLLGERDAGGRLCRVIADGGTILISFDDAQRTGQRLAAAGIIYGMTLAQIALVRLIVDGLNLVDASRQLRVSENTARTQLKRMFEKTSVSSQATLVRVLLNALAPLA